MRPVRVHWFTVVGSLLVVFSIGVLNPVCALFVVGAALVVAGLWIAGGEEE